MMINNTVTAVQPAVTVVVMDELPDTVQLPTPSVDIELLEAVNFRVTTPSGSMKMAG